MICLKKILINLCDILCSIDAIYWQGLKDSNLTIHSFYQAFAKFAYLLSQKINNCSCLNLWRVAIGSMYFIGFILDKSIGTDAIYEQQQDQYTLLKSLLDYQQH